MAGPFPGMDPWLESAALWPDFHVELATALRHELLPLLPPRYYVKIIERHVTDWVSPESLGVIVPDAAVLERPRGTRKRAPRSTATVTEAVEVQIEVPVPGKQPYLEIREVRGEDLVTAVEILSPSNKRQGSRDRTRYLLKRDWYLGSAVGFVEIDLLRAGDRWRAGDEPSADYRVLLSRAGRRQRAQIWPVALRDRLPVVPVPLRSKDADVALDLQVAFDRAYDEGGYRRFVSYGEAVPAPPLSARDLTWAKKRIRGARKT